MSIHAEMHDGTVLEFPDGTSTQVIQQVVRQQLKAAAPAQAKSAPKDNDSLLTKATGFMANVNRGLGIGDEIAGAVQGTVNAYGALSQGKGLAAVPNAYAQGMQQQRATEDRFQETNPHMAALGRGIGNVGPGLAIPVTGTTMLAGRAANAVSSAATAGLSGAAYAAADRGTATERLKSAGEAARNPLALALGAGAGALAPALSRAPKAKISPEVVTLRKAGVDLTPGQMRGGMVKTAEDAATSLPMLGTAVQEARTAGLEGWNKAAADNALRPVGLRIPASVAPGHDTVAWTERALGGLYDKLTPNGPVVVDDAMRAGVESRLGDITADMTDAGLKRLTTILDQRVYGRIKALNDNGAAETGSMSSANFRRVLSELNTVKGRFSGSQDADQRAIAESIDVVQDELRNAAARQDPKFAAQKGRIDTGYAHFKRLQSAAASPGAEGGVVTPAQYGGAVRRADKSVDKGATARGSALGQEFADAGRAVLPSRVPDSGTATRGIIAGAAAAPGALIAAGATAGPVGVAGVLGGYAATAATLKGLSKLYSPEAIALANKALDAKISRQEAGVALQELQVMAKSNGQVRDLYRKVAALAASGAGVATASAAAAGEPRGRSASK